MEKTSEDESRSIWIYVTDENGMLKKIEYKGKVLPFLDHYDMGMNKKLGKKLFKP